MDARETHLPSATADLVMRYPPNWTAVIFLGMLGLLHLTIAATSFATGHFEGFLSAFLGATFAAAAVGIWRIRSDVGILTSQRRVRLRTGLGPVQTQRAIDFQAVHGVRVVSAGSERSGEWRIEILCDGEEIECPPTRIPRQQALCLAMAMGVQLIKVASAETGQPGESMQSDPVRPFELN